MLNLLCEGLFERSCQLQNSKRSIRWHGRLIEATGISYVCFGPCHERHFLGGDVFAASEKYGDNTLRGSMGQCHVQKNQARGVENGEVRIENF